jgi:hypothetical protein
MSFLGSYEFRSQLQRCGMRFLFRHIGSPEHLVLLQNGIIGNGVQRVKLVDMCGREIVPTVPSSLGIETSLGTQCCAPAYSKRNSNPRCYLNPDTPSRHVACWTALAALGRTAGLFITACVAPFRFSRPSRAQTCIAVQVSRSSNRLLDPCRGGWARTASQGRSERLSSRARW